MGKTISCAECGKKTTLPFNPKGGGPFYCKKHYKEKKQKEEGDKQEPAPAAAAPGGMSMGMSQVPTQTQGMEDKQEMRLTVAMSPQLQNPEKIPEEEKVLPGLKNLKES